MNSEETATSESTEASPLDESQQREQQPEGTDWRAENTQLRQQLKKAKDLNREAMPYVQTAMALQAAPGGNAIIEKLQKGEALTAKQEAKVEEAQEKAGTTGISQEQLQAALAEQAQAIEQRMWEGRKAEKAMDGLHTWAKEKFPGYEELHETPAWNEKLDAIWDSIQKGTMVVPEGEDPHRHMVEQAYGWLKGLNPDIGKEKPSKKTEKDRRSAISQSAIQAGGVAPEDSDSLPDFARLDKAPRGPTGGGGRAFGSLKRD